MDPEDEVLAEGEGSWLSYLRFEENTYWRID